MLALLLTFLACSSDPPPVEAAPEPVVPADKVRSAGDVLTSTYVIFAAAPQDHLVPLACFDTSSLNSGRGPTCLDHMGLDSEVQLENKRMVKVGPTTSWECSSGEGQTYPARKSESPLGSAVRFGVWPNMDAAKWTARREINGLENPSHHRPMVEAASRLIAGEPLGPADTQRVDFRTALNLDIEGDGKKDALVEAFVRDEESGRVMWSSLFLAGVRPIQIEAPTLSLFGETRVLGAAQTTSKGAYLLLLESKLPTKRSYSVIQRTDQGFVSRGNWACETKG